MVLLRMVTVTMAWILMAVTTMVPVEVAEVVESGGSFQLLPLLSPLAMVIQICLAGQSSWIQWIILMLGCVKTAAIQFLKCLCVLKDHRLNLKQCHRNPWSSLTAATVMDLGQSWPKPRQKWRIKVKVKLALTQCRLMQ